LACGIGWVSAVQQHCTWPCFARIGASAGDPPVVANLDADSQHPSTSAALLYAR
jgi:hypothetical protein